MNFIICKLTLISAEKLIIEWKIGSYLKCGTSKIESDPYSAQIIFISATFCVALHLELEWYPPQTANYRFRGSNIMARWSPLVRCIDWNWWCPRRRQIEWICRWLSDLYTNTLVHICKYDIRMFFITFCIISRIALCNFHQIHTSTQRCCRTPSFPAQVIVAPIPFIAYLLQIKFDESVRTNAKCVN